MARKFCRTLLFTENNATRFVSYIMKFMYEFWGYCINSPATVSTPGGLASPTPSTFNVNFTEGTSVLASGTDGVTVNGQNTFTSATATFTQAMVGKYLTMWVSGSGSSDDSIYQILSVPNANTLVVNVANGGHPDPTTLHPVFTSRTSILYRVFDPDIATASAGATTNGTYIVFQMTPSSGTLANPNTGQANSQIQLIIRNSGQSIGLVCSPAATWTGSAFTDGTTEINPVSNGGGMSNGGGFSACVITMVGDLDGVFSYVRDNSSLAGYINFEAPIRVMTQAQDPNPVAMGLDGVTGLYGTVFGASIHNHWMPNDVGVIQRHYILAKCINGDGPGVSQIPTGQMLGISDTRIAYSAYRAGVLMSECLMHNPNTSHFVIARAKLKNVRMVPGVIPNFHRLGPNGEYVHIQNGICIPWDNTILPITLAPLGF